MKKLIYILILLLSFANGFSQKDSSEVQLIVDEMPEYPGGMGELMKFIIDNIEYPDAAKNKGYEGKVFVKFVVDSTGFTKNPTVLKSSGTAMLDEEAMRLVSIFPKWNPGKQNGKPVPVYFNLPISFKRLSSYESKQITDEEYANFYYNLGVKYTRYEKYDQAIKSYNKGLFYNKKDVDALYNLGAIYLKEKQTDKACIEWNKIKAIGKKDADELINKYCSQVSASNKGSNPVEKSPEYPGGVKQFFEFLGKNLKPLNEVKGGKYIVFSTFMVQADGSITNISIKQSSGNSLVDEEAKRILSIMPKWVPGQQAGKNVPVQFDMPINFSL